MVSEAISCFQKHQKKGPFRRPSPLPAPAGAMPPSKQHRSTDKREAERDEQRARPKGQHRRMLCFGILLGKGAVSPPPPPPRPRGGGWKKPRTVNFPCSNEHWGGPLFKGPCVLSTECSIMGTISRVLLWKGPYFPNVDRHCALSTKFTDRNLF